MGTGVVRTGERARLLADTFARHAITRTAIMASTFRSGSSYIAKILGRNGLKGIDQERFNAIATAPHPAVYLDAMAARFAGKVFPAKLMWPHRCDLARALDLLRDRSHILAQSFPGATWVQVIRRDKFRQAISLWRAQETGRWHINDASPEPQIPYDFAAIDQACRALCLHDRLWDDFFANAAIAPLRLYYEDVVADPGLLTPVLDRFDYALIETEVKLRWQSDDATRRYLDRYLADLYERGG